MTKKKKSIFKRIGFYFASLYTILTVAFIAQLFIVNVLPFKYIVLVVFALVLILLGLNYLQLSKRINKANRILGTILILLMSLLLSIGNWYLFATNSAFSKMTNDNSETTIVSVVVLKDSNIKGLEGLKNKKVGYSKTSNLNVINKAIKDFKKDMNNKIEVISDSTHKSVVESLYNKDIEAIILDEATRGMFEDEFEDFTTKTKVIKSYNYKTVTKDISKNVDVTSSPFNVYITGIDTYGTLATVARSDVNMIASVNPKTNQILLVSIPRDYYVPQTCQGNQKDKLTHTGIYGVNCTVDSMSDFLDIDVNYYARVNFSSLVDIVNSLGGITVDNPVSFVAFDNKIFPANSNLPLNGEQALSYSRERESLAGGDRDRGKNQMRVITGIINKALSPAIITKYTSILSAVSGSFQTNMTNSEMTSFIKKQVNDMNGWTITQYAVDGTGETNWSPANGFPSYVMQPDMNTVNKAVELINKLHAGEDISGLV